jgi:hypothetical protein
MSDQALHYSDGAPVMLGDQIRARVFLIPIRGSVVYVTGQSDPLPDFEIPQMASFAVQLRSGRTISWTRPMGARLERGFRLLSRSHHAPVDSQPAA